MEKVSAELFCFTYGAMVSQLLRQYKDAAEVPPLPLLIVITATRMKCSPPALPCCSANTRVFAAGIPSPGEDGPLHRRDPVIVAASAAHTPPPIARHCFRSPPIPSLPHLPLLLQAHVSSTRCWPRPASAAAQTSRSPRSPHRTAPRSCIDVLWQETVQVIARVGFKMFLNVNANVTAMNLEGTECK
jgi:hypothetical protein